MSRRDRRRAQILQGMRVRARHERDLAGAIHADRITLAWLHLYEVQHLTDLGLRGYAEFKPGSHFWKETHDQAA